MWRVLGASCTLSDTNERPIQPWGVSFPLRVQNELKTGGMPSACTVPSSTSPRPTIWPGGPGQSWPHGTPNWPPHERPARPGGNRRESRPEISSRNHLTMIETNRTIWPAGETDAGSAGTQPASDSRRGLRRYVEQGIPSACGPSGSRPFRACRRSPPCLRKSTVQRRRTVRRSGGSVAWRKRTRVQFTLNHYRRA